MWRNAPMMTNATILRIAFSFMIILAILSYGPGPAYSQQGDSSIQNLIINGGFEGGFQDDIGIRRSFVWQSAQNTGPAFCFCSCRWRWQLMQRAWAESLSFQLFPFSSVLTQS